ILRRDLENFLCAFFEFFAGKIDTSLSFSHRWNMEEFLFHASFSEQAEDHGERVRMTRAPAALVLKAQLHRMDTNGLFEPNRPREALKYFESKVAFTTGPVEVERALRDGERIILIDVRAAEDFEKGHVPGAVNLPE